MAIEKEITELLNDYTAGDLARALLAQTANLAPLSQADGEVINRILEDVLQELPVYAATRVGFWLGCAWQNLKD